MSVNVTSGNTEDVLTPKEALRMYLWAAGMVRVDEMAAHRFGQYSGTSTTLLMIPADLYDRIVSGYGVYNKYRTACLKYAFT